MRFILLIVFLILASAGIFLLFPKSQPTEIFPTVIPTQTFSPTQSTTPVLSLDERMKICESIPNGTTQEVSETTRLFINLPEDIYPFENRQFIFNGATAGEVTTSGGPTKGISIEEFLKNKCVSHYYDFEGGGTVDLKVKSAVPGLQDYELHFRVKKLDN